jgi:uncharacterized membrane protein YedE/YeeE
MDGFTPLSSLFGGALIGLAASVLLAFDGRIAGISGIVGGLLRPSGGDVAWRAAFVSGLLIGGVALRLTDPSALALTGIRPTSAVVVAGLLVGFGTRLGNGCTSGHGVCGVSRGSPRSIAATMAFMATGAMTVWLGRVLCGAW